VIRAVFLAGVALGLAGCPSQETPATAFPGMTGLPGMPMTAAMPPMPMTAAMPATAAPVAAAEPTQAELPVPEDFEDEAATSVGDANFRTELDRIAREVGATP